MYINRDYFKAKVYIIWVQALTYLHRKPFQGLFPGDKVIPVVSIVVPCWGKAMHTFLHNYIDTCIFTYLGFGFKVSRFKDSRFRESW